MVKIPCQALDRAGAGSGSSSVSAANGRCLIGRTGTYVIDFGLGYINSHLVVTVGSLLDSLLLCSRMNSTSETWSEAWMLSRDWNQLTAALELLFNVANTLFGR